MADGPAAPTGRTQVPGLAPGMAEAVEAILRASPGPIRRRALLGELERRGHRLSLAGLNRVLQQLAEAGRTVEGPEGVRLRSATTQ